MLTSAIGIEVSPLVTNVRPEAGDHGIEKSRSTRDEMDAHSDYPWLKSYPKFVDWHAAIPQLPAYAGFLNAVKNYPDNICLEFLGNFSN